MKDKKYEYAEIFKLLSNPVRLCILMNLVKSKRKNVTELTFCSNVAQAVVSQQLAKLKLSGVIKCEKVGNEVYYEIKDDKISNIISLLMKEEE